MKLITLNTWGGKITEPFIQFITTHKDTVDVFCFQEIFHEAEGKHNGDFEGAYLSLLNKIKSLLPEYVCYFCTTVADYYGIATFVKKDIEVKATGEIVLFENPNYNGLSADHDRKGLWVDLDVEGKNISILNVHGIWNGKGKTDTPERIEQSKRIRAFMDSVKGSQIVCGDFNLSPDTESLAILASGMQDLIKESGVTTTRTSYYTRAETSGRFADYIFMSKDLHVNDFKVLPDEVSDHAALYLDFE